MYGIKIGTSGTNCSNNIISLGNDSQATLYGIWETGSANNNNNLYFNTVYISGSPTSGDLNSYALYSNVTTNLRNFRNNIFCNKRSKTSEKTGKHYAAYFYTSPSATGLTEDYNNYYAPGTNGGTFGYFNGADVTSLDAWKTATGKDANSLNVDPGFAAGTSPSNFFPSATLPGITGTGITGDFNQYYRNATPKMGALESTSSSPNTVDVYIGASKQASYLNLKSAFDKINDGTHTGNRNIEAIIFRVKAVTGAGIVVTGGSSQCYNIILKKKINQNTWICSMNEDDVCLFIFIVTVFREQCIA